MPLQAYPAGGTTTDGENVGVSGVSVFKQRSGNKLQFKSINAGSSKVTVTNDASNNEVDIDLDVDQIDHGGLDGLGDDDHSQYILVAGTRAYTGNQSMGNFKVTNLGNPSANNDATNKVYVDAAIGTAIATAPNTHLSLTDIGTNNHATIDSFITSKGQASGLASLDTGSKVVQDPANAQTTPAVSKIPIAGAGGVLDSGWIPVSLTQASNADTLDGLHGSDYRHFYGFENRTDSTMSRSAASTFQITGTSYSFWTGSTKVTKAGASTVLLPTAKTFYYVYFDTDTALKQSTVAWDLLGNAAPVAHVYVDTSTNFAIFDERHGYRVAKEWHKWAHDTIGAIYESGLTTTFADATFSVATGVIHDEDIEITISSPKTACRLWYRYTGGASMTFESNITTPYKVTGTTLYYDNSGTLTPVGNGNYMVEWLYCNNDQDYPIAIVVGQNTYNTVALARNAVAPTLPSIDTHEWKLLYRAIYRQVNATTINYIESQDYRVVTTGVSTPAVSSDHQVLVNRNATDAHPASAIQPDTTNFAGLLSASDTTVQAALDTLDNVVSITQAVNSDKIDGYHYSDFSGSLVTNGNTHDHNGGDGAAITESALSFSNNTTANATTSAHGLAPIATAPSANELNVLGIGNGETTYSNKDLFVTTNPAGLGTAAPGTAVTAARSDHVHSSTVSVTFATNADTLDGSHASSFQTTLTTGNLTASSPISLDQTRQVIGGAAVISHATTAGNIHLPTGGSSNQILKNSGSSGTGSWGTVTESSGALGAITTISMTDVLYSGKPTGTAPFSVASITVNTNLNADYTDGYHASTTAGASTIAVAGAGSRLDVGFIPISLTSQQANNADQLDGFHRSEMLINFARITVSLSAPPNPSTNDLWVDIS